MITNRWGKRVTFILLALFTAGVGLFSAPRIHAALLNYIHPPDKNILVNRSFEPDDFSAVSSGSAVTVTIDATNSEDVALRGFYYSDQVPNGWVVSTASVSVSGSPIVDYTYGQGYANEIYTGFTPHRWALEMPQGEGVFSPTHPIPASGGTARIVYTMIVSGGTGSDYAIGHEAWAGWLTTTPTGTAVFGYQEIASTLSADFTAEPRIGVAPLKVQFTDLSTGGPTAWAWGFGDASPVSSQQNPTHTFTTPGTYTVTLTVTRAEPADSDTVIKPNLITVTAPPLQANFTAQPRFGASPLTVRFTDLSTGGPTAWAWGFGDASPVSSRQNPTHTFATPGTYTVTLTVTRAEPADSDTVIKRNFITVTALPLQANFTAQPRFGASPLTVQFTDLSVGDILTRAWDFGDGGTASLPGTALPPGPAHTYNISGHYTVTLTVQGAHGSDTLVRPGYIRVTDVAYTVFLPVVLRDHAQ
jgi:PKD repeat protein